MRVQDPLKYAEVLLSLVRPSDGLTQERIHALFGDSEIDIPFPAPVPVHVTYQTAFVNDHGQLEFRGDLYGHDQALLALMKGPERKVVDIPIQRRDNMTRRQLLAMPTTAGARTAWAPMRGGATPSHDYSAIRSRSRPRSSASPWCNPGSNSTGTNFGLRLPRICQRMYLQRNFLIAVLWTLRNSKLP
jgi:hypothetical protein